MGILNHNSTMVLHKPENLRLLSQMRYNYHTFTFGGGAQCSVRHVERRFLLG
jgi:hypothetical protein